MSTTTLTRPQHHLSAVPQPRPATGGVRLTRRGRVVVVLLGLAVLFAVGLMLSTTSVASESSEGYPTRVVMVAPGDTLWDIADDVAGDESTRSMVTTIERLNGLDGGTIQSGQRLVVPLHCGTTDFASRFDPGWRAGEDEGRG